MLLVLKYIYLTLKILILFLINRDLQLRIGNTGENFNVTTTKKIFDYSGSQLGMHEVGVYERSVISNFYTIKARSFSSLWVRPVEIPSVVVIGQNPVPSIDGNHTVSHTTDFQKTISATVHSRNS